MKRNQILVKRRMLGGVKIYLHKRHLWLGLGGGGSVDVASVPRQTLNLRAFLDSLRAIAFLFIHSYLCVF